MSVLIPALTNPPAGEAGAAAAYILVSNAHATPETRTRGVSLGEMNKILTQKIEELTLYTIELQKQIKELKNGK